MALPNQLSQTGATNNNPIDKFSNWASKGLVNLGSKAVNAVGNYAQERVAGGIQTATKQLGQMNAKQPMTATGITPTVKSNTTTPGILPSNAVSQNNTKTTNVQPTNPQADVTAAHAATVKATQEQLKSARDALKLAQQKESNAIATYPAGETPKKDANGDIVPYVAPTAYQSATGSLLKQGAEQDPTYLAAINKANELQNQEAGAIGNIGEQPMTAGSKAGQSGTVKGVMNTQVGNELARANAALTGKAQQITANTAAGGLTQPVGQFGVLTDPVTGQPVNGQSATQAAQYGGYVQGVQQGAQAQGAVSGTTNAANAANAGTQAFSVNLALSQVNSLTPVIKNFLSRTGINPSDAQIYNAPIKTYLSKIQASGQITQWDTLMSELNRYSSQLIGTGSLTPTGVTQATQLQNPSDLSLSQIDSVLQTLSDVGNNQVYNLQQQTNAAAPGNQIYTGDPVKPVTSTKPAPVAAAGTPGAGVTDPVGQFAAGTGLNVGAAAINQDWGGRIASFILRGFFK